MEELKDKILREAIVIGNDTVKVDGFLNHMLDVGFLERVGRRSQKDFPDAVSTRCSQWNQAGSP